MTVTDRRITRRFVPLMVAVIAVVGIIDQATKALMLNLLQDGNIIYVIGDWFRFRLLFNPGAAFSMGENATWLFTCFQIAFLSGVLIYSPKVRDRFTALSLALIGGGALGNLIDRLFRAPEFFIGHVVDFISVGNFAVFNIADAAITTGVALFIVSMVVEDLLQRRAQAKADITAVSPGGEK
ncbi:signal peptidase II [Corynebacterium felinum]|uniref:Lipoprotein signal peptidase n=1 Tax=Corynebacterium felinum TaxID=131318 RepID=A0ABU2BBW9_9CORY|nr:signal peptidase II [Corynebacterium felinum]MDF5820939.1 signal peptidase II [Corynebacterium felinum]MDR7356116.1 signal peptidase II [Corynebacterium felinum]